MVRKFLVKNLIYANFMQELVDKIETRKQLIELMKIYQAKGAKILVMRVIADAVTGPEVEVPRIRLKLRK